MAAEIPDLPEPPPTAAELAAELQSLTMDMDALERDSPELLTLRPGLGTYADAEQRRCTYFALVLRPGELPADGALMLTCVPLPVYVTADGVSEAPEGPVGGDAGEGLVMFMSPGEQLPSREDAAWAWTPADGEGPKQERSLTLAPSDPRLAGETRFTVGVWYDGPQELVSFRCAYEVVQRCDAQEIAAGQTLRGENGQNEWTYYRYVHRDPRQLITIRAKLVFDDAGEAIGDPDLYVTNTGGGLAAVTRENCTWKSTNVGADRVDIHPSDAAARLGNVFVIGILGYKERNVFDVEVEVTSPQAITPLAVGGEPFEAELARGGVMYFALPIENKKRARLTVRLAKLDPASGEELEPAPSNAARGDNDVEPSYSYARGVYAVDELSREAHHSLYSPDPAPYGTLRPVLHMSNTCLYPSEEDNNWTASSRYGPLQAFLECDEWKYSTPVCHMALSWNEKERPAREQSERDRLRASMAAALGISAEEAARSLGSGSDDDEGDAGADAAPSLGEVPVAESVRFRVTVTEQLETDMLSEGMRTAYELFGELFADVDGGSISQRDRADAGASGNNSLTYGEVEFLSFNQLLQSVRPREGLNFCDLGCGTGKAVVIAAMSELRFAKCTGIELLPGLHASAVANTERAVAAAEAAGVPMAPVEILQGDMTQIDWSDADVVYTSSICFGDELMEGIAACARRMKPGSFFLTLKQLPDSERYFSVYSSAWRKMSWGRICVYCLRRRDADLPEGGGSDSD